MGLGYFFILILFCGAGVWAVLLLAAARYLWRRTRYRALVFFPLLGAGLCAAAAGWLLALVLREPPWSFRF